MSPEFIYFDLDDTLLDHKKAERSALLDLHSHFDIFSPVPPDMLVDTYHDINRELWEKYGNKMVDKQTLKRERFERTLKELSLDPTLHDETSEYYMDRYRDHWCWIEGAEKVLQKVSRNYKTGILTNGFSEVQKMKINRFELDRYASHLVISEEVGYLKPQPEIFQYATTLTGLRPEQILYIGDSYNSDILGGSEFGWKTVWFVGKNVEENGKADFVISGLSDLLNKLNI